MPQGSRRRGLFGLRLRPRLLLAAGLLAIAGLAILPAVVNAGYKAVFVIDCPPDGLTQDDVLTVHIYEAATGYEVRFFDPVTFDLLTPEEVAQLCPGGDTVDIDRSNGDKPGKDAIDVTVHSTGQGTGQQVQVGVEALVKNDLGIEKEAINHHNEEIVGIQNRHVVTYRLTLMNRGPLESARKVRVVDHLPPGCVWTDDSRVQYTTALGDRVKAHVTTPPRGTRGGTVIIDYTTPLSSGRDFAFITCEVRQGAGVNGNDLTNEATIESLDPAVEEPNPDPTPNEATLTIKVRH